MGWLQAEDRRLHLPAADQWKRLETLHYTFYLGSDKTPQMTQKGFLQEGT